MKKFQFRGWKLVELSMDDYLLCDPNDAYDPSGIGEWFVHQPKREVFLALQGVPHVLEHICKCYPEQADLLRTGVKNMEGASFEDIQRARDELLYYSGNFVMVKDPAAYDASIRHLWNIFDVVDMEDILDKIVVDVGAGTGAVTWKCSLFAKEIYAVEPLRRLREYIKRKAQAHCMDHIHVLEGTLGSIPLADNMTDTIIVAFVVSTGWSPEDINHAVQETTRVTRCGGKVTFIVPGLQSDECEEVFVSHGYSKSTMETPCDDKMLVFRKEFIY
jgi:SAM-dependent methyltransferase